MIKFFRIIRQKLINDGNLKRYLIYAIGEILLVVIGILIALQINNWNENQKKQNEAFNYFVDINKEFAHNRTELEKVVMGHEMVLENCQEAISYLPINLEKVDLDTFSKLIDETWRFYKFNPSENAINSLLNSSSFQSIKNNKLKELLSSWKVILKNFKEEEIYSMDFVLNIYDPYLSDNFHYDFDFSDPRTDLSVLQTFKFENLLKERAWRQNDLLREDKELEILLETIDEVIILTEKEIQGNDH